MIRYVWIFYTVFVLALMVAMAHTCLRDHDRRMAGAVIVLFGGLFWLLVVLSPLRR